WAEKGKGAWQICPGVAEPFPARVSDVARLEDALFVTTDVFDFDRIGREGAYDELERVVRITRGWGDAYGYYLVATGKAEIMIDPFFEVWDAAPLKTVLEEAGGWFGDWNGVATIEGREGVGTNAALRDAVVEITRKYPRVEPIKR
ncbi:MAG: inositol monophosphatase, partial [Thermoguttaceae bacterium]|nr:inositol monophosphatase [Thermoguttaceae bacterium]